MTDAQNTLAIRTLRGGRVASHSRLRRVIADKHTLTGLCFLLIVLFVVAFGPVLAPYTSTDYVGLPYALPSAGSPLGTDSMGQDVLSRVLRGGFTVVWMSLGAATIGMVLGVVLGTIAGLKRGWIDEVIMRLADVTMAMPALVLTLLFISLLGKSLLLIVALVGLAHAPSVARIVRGVTADVAEREYVESAIALGASSLKTAVTEIIPNITGTIMVEYGLRIVWSVIAIAGLSVLGQGVSAPQADWGLMINENRGGLALQPWAVVAPLLFISMYALAANLIAEGIGRTLHIGAKGKVA
ncbi:ABC transporter permease [Leifsonia kafniensis]|uniref:ABC transporter permease n=1 Tax=Leifsonia kafniensis TaxID=475957 RepID=A0ABP7KPI3_9MICO